MNNGPKISIITACFNAKSTIEQTIQSVINQTYNNIEYIIVDGASTDGTMDIVRKYTDHIDIIISERDGGVYDAFNKGALVATGDYIQYLNADDYLIGEYVIADAAKFIEDNRDAVIVYGGVLTVNEGTGHKFVNKKKVSYEQIEAGVMIPHQATFTSRTVLIEMGLFDLSYSIAADNDLLCKIYKVYNEKIRYLPHLIAVFRTGGLSSDLKNLERFFEEKKGILNKHFIYNSYNKKHISNEELLKIWLEKIIFQQKSISEIFTKQSIKKVALWGTGELSVILYKDLVNHFIEVLCYIDNNKDKQGMLMNNIPILSLEAFIENDAGVDCIVMTFEGNHERAALEQINSHLLSRQIAIYSWRDLIKQL